MSAGTIAILATAATTAAIVLSAGRVNCRPSDRSGREAHGPCRRHRGDDYRRRDRHDHDHQHQQDGRHG